MRDFIYSRNAVYETLRARRREVFKIQIAEGAQEKGRLAEILKMAKERRIPVERRSVGGWIKSIRIIRVSWQRSADIPIVM